MKINEFAQGFSISLEGQEIINHTKARPFLTVGSGTASYNMKRGSFKIKDRIKNKRSLCDFTVERMKNEILIIFSDKEGQYRVEVLFSQDNDKLELTYNNLGKPINRMWFSFVADPDEHVYGCGEQFTHLDLKGQKVRIWVAEHQCFNRMILKLLRRKLLLKKPDDIMAFKRYETYYSQPTFVTSKKMFFHIDSDAYMEFDFSRSNTNRITVRDIPRKIIIGKSDSFIKLLKSMSDILGRQPKLPEWTYKGVILGIQGGTGILLKKVRKAEEHGVKIAGIWCQDWSGRRITSFGKQVMWNWEWDKELYPNLDKVIPELNQKGIRFLGYINPFLAIEGSLYKEASQKGYTVKNKKGDDYKVTITTFPAAMIDLTNPDAFEWIKNIIKQNMIDFGLSGWMADFGEYLPVDAVLCSGEDAELVHNKWPALWAKANREAIEEAGKIGEVFFFTRAGHTGTIRYSTLMWNGDQHVDWSLDDGLPSVIPATLSLALSGFGICHSDIGGYTTLHDFKRSKELLMRWAELCAFSPVMRSHEGNRPDDNIQFDFDYETLDHFAQVSRIYSRLEPYIKACVEENSEYGKPVMRPLFMHYEDDSLAYTLKYQYLLGQDILVAPVIQEGVVKWSVYLPKDEWVHLWSGNEYSVGWCEVGAPIGYPPVFYRKASPFRELFESLSRETPSFRA